MKHIETMADGIIEIRTELTDHYVNGEERISMVQRVVDVGMNRVIATDSIHIPLETLKEYISDLPNRSQPDGRSGEMTSMTSTDELDELIENGGDD